MKKLITIITAAALIVSFSMTSAYAGSARRHTVEGVVLGTILGVTIASAFNNDSNVTVSHNYRDRNDNRGYGGWDRRDSGFSNQYPRNRYNDRWDNHRTYDSKKNRGYWVEQEIWVAPVYRKVWVDSHRSSHRGRWVPGHYKTIQVRDGYYKTERIWVSRY